MIKSEDAEVLLKELDGYMQEVISLRMVNAQLLEAAREAVNSMSNEIPTRATEILLKAIALAEGK